MRWRMAFRFAFIVFPMMERGARPRMHYTLRRRGLSKPAWPLFTEVRPLYGIRFRVAAEQDLERAVRNVRQLVRNAVPNCVS